ncbi:MAG TPA: alpha/beta hydrolase [Sporichthya sp.]|nr:alpha/beta hydrolase [Sporichthya sp.]
MSAVRNHDRRTLGLLGAALWLLNLLRWARRTRPEPLPPAPVGSTTVETGDGTRLHVQVGGRNDADVTVMFVHGFLARTISFDMQWQHLGTRARLVRYDHRNHGRSGHSRNAIDVQTLAGDLADVLRQVAPRGKVVLVGHSMGGMTILALAHDHPDLFAERVAGVALLATGAGHYIEGHRVEDVFRWGARRGLLGPGSLLLRVLAPALEHVRPRRTHRMRGATKRLMFGTGDADPSTVAMVQDLLEGPPVATMASLQGALVRHDMVRALPQLRGRPVLVLTGSEDRLTRPEHSRRMAADIGLAAELVMIPGAGHVVNQTRPSETNAALGRLLDRVDAAAPTAAAPASDLRTGPGSVQAS